MDLVQELHNFGLETESYLQSITGMLQQLISLTEEKYAYVYETLPASEQDIKVSIREVEILLNYLIFNSDGGTGEENSIIITALNLIQQEFEEVTESFLNKELISVLLKTFLDETGKDDQSFSELGRLAVEVKDTLAGLRDLALNSIIFSIRAGSNGAGFQIVSDRINEISTKLSSQFAGMNETINELNTWNNDFQKKLVEFIEYEEKLKTKYQDKFNQEFTRVKDTLRLTCDFLNNHLNSTKTVVHKVPEAMVLIQNQDIIRQNIENMVKCLQILLQRKAILAGQQKEEILNYLIFAGKATELANALTDNIETGLAESIMALEEVLQDISEQATDLEEESQSLGAFFGGSRENPTAFNVINDVFTTIIGQVVDLLYIKRHIESKSKLLLDGRETFIRLMKSVEQDFESINREIRTLKKMRVLIKIELARIETENNNSMNNIVGAVDQVIYTVSNNQILFNKLRNYFIHNIDQFNYAVERTKDKLVDSGEALEVSRKKLSQARHLASGAVQAMVSEMGGIFTNLKEPYRHMKVMDQVQEMLLEVRRLLNGYNEMIDGETDRFYGYYGIQQWEEKEEDLKALLEQFTCYVERKSADVVFSDVSQGLDEHSTDIVLF